MRATSLEVVQERLGKELARRDGKVRRLARDISETANVKLERARRAIYRIQAGTAPEPETSAMFEVGLGKPSGYFTVAGEAARPSRADRLRELEAVVADQAESIDALVETAQILAGLIAASGVVVPDLPIAAHLRAVEGSGP